MEETMQDKQARTAEKLGIEVEQMPLDIAIIMDGNGRWAQSRSLPRAEGHRQGGKVVEKIALDCVDLGIESLTLYSFSTENWKRPRAEIEALMHLYSQYLEGIRPIMMKNNVKLVHLGVRDNLPDHVLEALDDTIAMTSGNDGMKLALALNYSGRAEIADACKRIAQDYKEGKVSLEDIDVDCISRHLYLPNFPEPDLLVRTANEMRVSNFLLWQISYSEFYITSTYWPDFNRAELEKAILEYAGRDRRFGAVK
jgi:undecaprenyl diphosphate synthase